MRRMYSKEQLAKQIQNADFTAVDLKVKTIEQTEPNWAVDIDSFGTFGTLEPVINFGRVQLVNGMLYFIFSIQYNNKTASDITSYNTGEFLVDLPDEIASKIYDVNGDNLMEASTNIYIASTYSYASKAKSADASQITGNPRLTLLHPYSAKKINVRFNSNTSMTCPANGFIIIEGRIELSLI